MVYNFKVFKKCAPNGKVTLYMGKRDFVDHISFVEPIGACQSLIASSSVEYTPNPTPPRPKLTQPTYLPLVNNTRFDGCVVEQL